VSDPDLIPARVQLRPAAPSFTFRHGCGTAGTRKPRHGL